MPLDNDQLNEKIHAIDRDVSVLTKDNEIQTKLMEKFDRQLDILTDLAQAMNRSVSIHTEKWLVQDRANDYTKELITERRTEARDALALVEDRLEEKYANIIEKLEHVYTSVTNKPMPSAPVEKKGLNVVIDFVLNNWKIFAFGLTFGAGIFTHKWGLFAALFSGT
jgi:hypothetical protein